MILELICFPFMVDSFNCCCSLHAYLFECVFLSMCDWNYVLITSFYLCSPQGTRSDDSVLELELGFVGSDLYHWISLWRIWISVLLQDLKLSGILVWAGFFGSDLWCVLVIQQVGLVLWVSGVWFLFLSFNLIKYWYDYIMLVGQYLLSFSEF